MIIDGKAIAERVKSVVAREITRTGARYSLAVFVLTDDFATRKFISIKKKVAENIGVTIVLYDLKKDTRTEELVQKIKEAVHNHNGIVVQFPLPSHINSDTIRNAIPASHDVDVISDEALQKVKKGSNVLPPVVGAIDEILKEQAVTLKGKKVVVVGEGNLVGKPSAIFAEHGGANVTVVNEDTKDISKETKDADIIILGAGVPGLLMPTMVKDGVVILDAGTSEAKGELRGDADPSCALKSALFTPVPGGVGPITVAMIFKNLLVLASRQRD
ncbi:MAG TPA: bifunctional 5,10-methylenetetrahydrofolate dehydrogenase/5,10-methenyltetrahydrofolate cyclohydrolase [Candidatus Paceibacterota bacterium]